MHVMLLQKLNRIAHFVWKSNSAFIKCTIRILHKFLDEQNNLYSQYYTSI